MDWDTPPPPGPYPMTAHLQPRKDGEPRTIDEQGFPIYRISYTYDGKRRVALIGKPNLLWARMWAQRLAREHGWTEIMVGRWHGALPIEPAPWSRG